MKTQPDTNQQPNYKYTIDKSTGNLLIIQDVNNPRQDAGASLEPASGGGSVSISNSVGLSGDALTLLQVLDDRDYVVEAQTDQITFHSAENINPETGDSGGRSQLRVDEISNQNQTQHLDATPLRRAMWSRKKIADFIKCILNHALRFQKSSKTKMNIWNAVSADMFQIGHLDCNKDECNKKWNNLYRTWKKVKLRPKQDRHKWQYYQPVTSLVKCIYKRDSDKKSSKKSLKPTTQELIVQMLEQNRIHQETISEAETTFQNKVQVLENERDAILLEIKKSLEVPKHN